ncbi:hypothetical protein AAES_141554 [Amazona aestiva]|uniref:Matrix-remodeling-associated protein 7 n=1 Tax=Amazona aestiva TaxID=12930 RepID=A0A0Q3QRL6_AMAAE|nr:hypothetical protein AAES_141554 [Amazona aestiva]
MDMTVDLYLAIPLLFTVLVLVLASMFVKLWGAEGKLPQEPPGAEPDRESCPGDHEAGRKWLPVQEVRVVEEGKEAATEQREEVVEKPRFVRTDYFLENKYALGEIRSPITRAKELERI